MNESVKKLRTINVEDEPMASELLVDYIKKVSGLELIGSFRNGLDALSFLQSNQVDLMFLDINMPDLSGVELARSLKNPPMIIFTTAYSDYAVEGFDLMAVDYLLKPIDFVRFLKACNKAIELGAKTEAPVHLEAKNEQEFILLKSGKETHRLRFDHIYYLEGSGNYITYHTSSGKLLSLQTMKELEEELPRQFVRIHKSFIVNIDHVDSFESHQVKVKGSDLPISQANREAFLKRVAKPI